MAEALERRMVVERGAAVEVLVVIWAIREEGGAMATEREEEPVMETLLQEEPGMETEQRQRGVEPEEPEMETKQRGKKPGVEAVQVEEPAMETVREEEPAM